MVILFVIIQPILSIVNWTRMFIWYIGYRTLSSCWMKPTVLSSYSFCPHKLWCDDLPSDHICSLRCWYARHFCSKCCVVCSSIPQVHSCEGTRFRFLCMCELSLLWPVYRRNSVTCPVLSILGSHLVSHFLWTCSSLLLFSCLSVIGSFCLFDVGSLFY